MRYYRQSKSVTEYGLIKYTNRVLADTDTAISQEELFKKSSQKFRCSAATLQQVFDQAIQSGALIRYQYDQCYYLTTKKYKTQDQRIAHFLNKRLHLTSAPLFSEKQFDDALGDCQQELAIILDADQRQVLYDFFVRGQHSLAISGAAGTGKTSLIQVLALLLAKTSVQHIYGAAVSGKASQKLEIISTIPSSTLHSLFQIPVGFKRRKRVKPAFLATAEILVVDESSMLSSELFVKTIAQLSTKTRLILLGDPKQLPPIESGQPFRDILSKKLLACYNLTQYHRAPADSAITQLAQSIRHRQTPNLEHLTDRVTLLPAKSLAAIRASLLCSCTQLAAQTSSVFDWQVLSFTNVSPIGTIQLNAEIQALFDVDNTSTSFIKVQDKVTYQLRLAVGDKVMHEINSMQQSCSIDNYMLSGFSGSRKELKNGTLGQVVDITDKYVYVKYPELKIVSRYTSRQVETSLTLAWCLTVHKCQGSEFNNVILPIAAQKSQLMVASNELLYSAVTRARQSLTFIGDSQFFSKLCRNQVPRVFSSLQYVSTSC